MNKHLPYYEIKGTYQEVGEFLGSTFRKQIQATITKSKTNIKNYDSYLPKSKKCFDITKNYLPNLITETEATAKAADVAIIDFFFINNREVYDAYEGWDKPKAVNSDHCTVVAGFKNNKLTIGHNEDWAIEALDDVYILKATIGDIAFIGLNYNMAVVGVSASINNFGLVQCINDLYQTSRIGVPKNYIARAVLEARSLNEAESIIKNIPCGSGFNHVLAQGSEIRSIEIAGDSIGIQKLKNVPYAHTNHYLNKDLKKLEKFGTKNSEERLKRATELLKPEMELKDIVSILSDKKNKRHPICREEATVGSAVFIPSELKAYFCYGPPSSGYYIEYLLA